MSSGLTSRTEVRLITGAGAVLAGTAVASAVSPSIEEFLNYWVTVTAVGGVSATAVYLGARWLWLTAMIEWEIRRPLRPDEFATPPPHLVESETEVRDA